MCHLSRRPRRNGRQDDYVQQRGSSCIGENDRTQLENFRLCARSHPPVLDALTALHAQDNRPGSVIALR